MLGWVADFCPICRQPRAFRRVRVGLVSHLYFVSIGSGKLVGFEVECSECGTSLETEETRHASVEKNRPGDFAALAAATMPNMPELLGARLALEKTVRESPKSLDPELRERMLAEPFTILNPVLEARQKQTQMDKPAVLGCLGTGMLTVALLVALVMLPREWENVAGLTLLTLVGIGIIYTITQLALVNRRYQRRMILPKLSKALAPLQPDREELEAILSHFRERKMQIGKRTKLDELWSELHPLA